MSAEPQETGASPAIPGAGVARSRTRRRMDARDALRDRVLTVAGQDAIAIAPHIDAATGGLVVAGSTSVVTVERLRMAYPGLLLIAEPPAPSRYLATRERPFLLDGNNDDSQASLWAPTLSEIVDAQRLAGADVVVTPTGLIATADAGAAKSAVDQANELDGNDILLLLPVEPLWCAAPLVSQLIAIAKGSRHPVAISLAASSGDPWSVRGVVPGLHRFFSEVPDARPWRTDLAGFAAISWGAPGAAIGLIPSLRRLSPPDATPFATKPHQHFPHVLLPRLLRFSRSNVVQGWFASTEPHTCECTACDGRALDRFGESERDQRSAALHNLEILNALTRSCVGTPPADRGHWWGTQLQGANLAHMELEADTQVSIEKPADLEAWLRERRGA